MLLVSWSTPLFADPPDAGQLLNEQRQMQQELPKRPPAVIEQDTGRAPTPEPGLKVKVKGFKFSRIEAVANSAELADLLKDAIGRELGIADLQALAARVTNYLREEKGFLLARAYLPRQDITDGIIEIAIIAGRTEGKVLIDMQGPRRIREGLLEGIAARSVTEGEALRLKDIEEAVLSMNDLPGISARASLERGDIPGTTKLVIRATEGPLLGAFLSFDNFGDRYTGIRRAHAQISANDPSGLGDQLTLGITGAEDIKQFRASYALPLGSSGMTWSVYFSHLVYTLGSDFEELDADGSAQTLGTSLGYALLRTRDAGIRAGLGYENLILRDEAGGSEIRKRTVAVGNAGLNGSFFDGLGG